MATHPLAIETVSRGGVAPLMKVLVVDDQAAVREGLSKLIRAAPNGPREVHTASTPAEALRLLAQTQAQVVVLDVDLAGDDGLALLPALLVSARVIVLTSHGDPATRARAWRLGAEAFVEKGEPAAALLAQLARLSVPRVSLPQTGGSEAHRQAPQTSPLQAVESSLSRSVLDL